MWDDFDDVDVDFDEREDEDDEREDEDEDMVCGDRILDDEDRRRWYEEDDRGDTLTGDLTWAGADNPSWDD